MIYLIYFVLYNDVQALFSRKIVRETHLVDLFCIMYTKVIHIGMYSYFLCEWNESNSKYSQPCNHFLPSRHGNLTTSQAQLGIGTKIMTQARLELLEAG